MPTGILSVESSPESADEAAAYHDRSENTSPPVGLRTDPPPTVRLLRDIACYRP
ncbi:hypothetical protein [Nocardia harenae]|uniref:hypothetical protein n=1 Tax=Nocardia harenae TaxID=358707 RepID=UPI000A928965|nr:hypothetical protein [Nocardia harenae]